MQSPEVNPTGPISGASEDDFGGLEAACSSWEVEGDERPLRAWLGTELDYDGSPRRLAVETWAGVLERIGRAARARAGWSRWVRDRVGGLVMWRVHASRPDGSTVFGPPGRDRARTSDLVAASALADDPALAAVVSRWFPEALPPGRRPVPPPLPAVSDNDRVLALLRPDWNATGDWLAVDQRAPGDAARFELTGDGRPWLQGAWRSEGLADPDVLPRPTRWETGPHADALEWTFRAGPAKVVRTAVLLRYRKVALIAQQEEGPSPSPTSALRVTLAGGVAASPSTDLRSWTLTRGRTTARLIPLALPARSPANERGSLAVEAGEAVLRQPSAGPRRWLPLVVAWGKPPALWRALTVTEKSQPCPPGVAFGARISWGVGQDGLLIYRSLGRPALRAVLGLQTRARFLVGKFTAEGDVEPLLTIE